MKLRYYVMQRILMLIPTFIIVSFLMYFFLLEFYKGDPVVLYIPSIFAAIYYRIHPAELAALRVKYGFDKPWYIQWFNTVIRILTGNWGYSPKYGGQPVIQVVAKALPATLEFVIPGLILAVIIGIPLGIKSSIAEPKQDFYIQSSSLIGISIPGFVVALVVKAIEDETFFYFGVVTNTRSIFDTFLEQGQYNKILFGPYPSHLIFGLPVTNFLLIDSLLSLNFWLFLDALLHVVGPMFCIMIFTLPFVVKMTKWSMKEALREDYIILARSKGLEEKKILYRHAFRNALLPMTSMFGYLFTQILMGTVYIEIIFNYPGIGYMLFLGFNYFDLGLILAFLILTTTMFIIFNFLVDIFYYIIDPRINSPGIKDK